MSESPGPEKSGAAGSVQGQRQRALLWAVCFILFRALVPLAGRDRALIPVMLPVVLLLFLLFSLLGPKVLAPLPLRPAWRVGLFLLFAALALLTPRLQVKGLPAVTHSLLAGYSDLFLITAAALFAQMFAGLFREPNILVPVAVVAAVVDFWGVNYGTTHAILAHHPEVVNRLSAEVPLPGMPDQIGIGFGDFVFLSLFLACARQFSLREGLTFWLAFAFMLPATLIVLAGTNVPALVPIAAAFLAANARRFRFQRSELVAMLVVGLAVAALLALAMHFRPPAPAG